LSANLQALGLFGIDEVFACQHSLAERGLAAPASAEALGSAQISQLIDRYDQVITL
ncbi:DsrE family protein, partial [Pseudomonas sp. SIMBA_067]